METTKKASKHEIKAGDFSFTFLSSGDLYKAAHTTAMINQLLSNPIDGSLNNVYLRLFRPDGIHVVPLLGVQSESKVQFSDNQAVWQGTVEDIRYQVTFSLTPQGVWFWDVNVEGHGAEIDIIYGQDTGIASEGAILSNQAYMAQYVDHKVFESADRGYVVCSRQNQPQPGGFPYLQQGALTKAVGYLTDGFQFFGLSYKETNRPEVLYKQSLPNEIYQYEFSYTALQSERVKLTGAAQFVFYGLFKQNHPTAITSLEFEKEVSDAWEQVKAQSKQPAVSVDKVSIADNIGAPLQTDAMTEAEVGRLFPTRHQEERDGHTLLSFFTDTHEHVVLKAKELLVERPHGHILMTGHNDSMKDNVLTTTSYMTGVFNSQLVVGNTSFNKMLSNTRNHLNVFKASGQRIYVEIEGSYRLLTMPSMFELGFNYARWYYKTPDELFVITNFTTVDTPEVQLHVRAESGKAYRYLVTNQVVVGNNEYEAPFRMEHDGQTITFTADAASLCGQVYPKLSYRLQVQGTQFSVENETKLAPNAVPQSASLVVLELSPTNEWTMTVQGLLRGEELPFVTHDAAKEIEGYRGFFRNVMNEFQLSHNGALSEELQKVNSLAWWYTHNMLVHFSVPHGLEQFGGAAWGTRDVCQGPAEYFMVTQKYDTVKQIIKMVYSHQFVEDGNWPQWFMFDNYYKIQAGESHGDVIVWPLKVLGDYLAATNDFSILQEKVPYTTHSTKEPTAETATILDHARKEIDYIKQHFLHDTHLSSYGDGDWDDTLQPANAQLKKYLISSWTVALTYQTIRQLAKVLAQVDEKQAAELKTMASGIESDFNKYMLQNEVIPGFVYMENEGQAKLMLHPDDTETGIQYRLLPMTRSMIGELLTPEQAESHYEVIRDKLYHPDGVRLMNRPANYAGGVSTHFQRAEQGSNFGREIGLQYVHAHIRFVEAMAKLGKVEEVWRGLAVINPIGIKDVVPNAERRQSNSYFSSSDGKFSTRYEAQENFDKLRDGTAAVKGGWRIYSSGPGIYMNQLISNCLGIRQASGGLIIDPVLPDTFSGLKFDYKFMGRSVTFVYHLKQAERRATINGQTANTEEISNRYRQGGFFINSEQLQHKLVKESNVIEIYL